MSLVPLLCFVWTVALYLVSKAIYRRFRRIWLTPAIVVPALTIGMILLARISYADYIADTRWIMWLMGPATVAFAVPIYQYRDTARRHWLALSIGIVVGMGVALFSSLWLAHALNFDHEVTRSLMARSISTPFAMALVEHTGGSRELVVLFTIITGLIGMLAGDAVLAMLRLRSPLAQGASFGASAHGFGTARARERSIEEGIVASLTMVLSGVIMVLAGPALTDAVSRLLG